MVGLEFAGNCPYAVLWNRLRENGLYSNMNQDAGALLSLSHQFRQHVRIKQSRNTLVSLQVLLLFPSFFFCLHEKLHFKPIHFTASLFSLRTILFPTSMSVSMLNKSNLKKELSCDVKEEKKKTSYINKNNSNHSASSAVYLKRCGNRCSPLQHIRGAPASVTLKVPVTK